MKKNSHVGRAERYAQDVVAGRIPAAKWTRGACERQLYDLERWNGKDAPYYFDPAAAEFVCNVIERMPHIKGIWAQRQERVTPEPWQSFILTTVFGWKRRVDGYRRFRTAYIECPRKNAKSTLSSAVGLYLLACDSEPGALVVSAATTRTQAKLVFADAQAMARKESGFQHRFGVSVFAHAIAIEKSSSKFEALSSEDSNLDGLNVHGAIIDELHAHKTRGVWDVLETATGARAQPLLWAITTAGVDQTGICFEQHTYVKKILDKVFEDESYFGVIYGIDEGDDWRDESAWKKANPNYGISIYPDKLAFAAKKAEQLPSALNAFLQKHLNVWVNADVAWLPANAWQACTDKELDIEDLAGEPCFLALDLATRSDIAAMALLFPPADDRPQYAIFCRYYLPEAALDTSPNAQYAGWEHEGRLNTTPGDVTDFDSILDDLFELATRFDVQKIALDPYQSLPLTNAIQKRGMTVPLVDVRQTVATFSPAMKEFEALVRQKKIKHDGDPVMSWMVSNVVAHVDAKDNIYPRKERAENKIDGVIAALMALDQALRAKELVPDYAERGLWKL